MNRRDRVLNAPAYSIQEAAHFLRLPVATLRAWAIGQVYRAKARGPRTNPPVIEIADPVGKYLSFINLVEAHVLSAIRRRHHVPLSRVRTAICYVRAQLGTERPLADQQFMTDGGSLFIESLGELVNASREGQLGIRQLLERHLARIERDPKGIPIRLFPFIKNSSDLSDEEIVAIDPHIAFGRPIIQRIAVRTSIIAERHKAGDSISALSADYDAQQSEIEEAIRCEFEAKSA